MQITRLVLKTGRTAHRYLRSFCCYTDIQMISLPRVVLSCSVKYVLVICLDDMLMPWPTSMVHKIMLLLASQVKTGVKKSRASALTSGNVSTRGGGGGT